MISYVSGAGGFIGGHLVARLLEEDEDVIAVDIKPLDEWHQVHGALKNIHSCDLSDPNNVDLDGVDTVYHLAADMGGMGFISSHRIDCMESVVLTINLLNDAQYEGVQKFFYASSACVYPDFRQRETHVSLKESDAWPADPEPGYGLEKLYGEQLCKFYKEEYGLETRVARFHNIFGEYGTFKGGREKAPAALCRKVAEAVKYGIDEIDIWGDGEQTRSFLHVDECIEGIMRLVGSDIDYPLNIGSNELVSVNSLVTMIEDYAGVKLKRRYDLSAPQGVRGRNSDNTLIRQVLGWAPNLPLRSGIERTFDWISEQV